MPKSVEQQLLELQQQVTLLKQTLGTLIAWISTASNAPIGPAEREILLNALEKQSDA